MTMALGIQKTFQAEVSKAWPPRSCRPDEDHCQLVAFEVSFMQINAIAEGVTPWVQQTKEEGLIFSPWPWAFSPSLCFFV
jgi:hypothetical protein